jgi:DNA polymerase-3 subunit alpha
LKLEGQVRGIGKHAAAVIITEKDLRYSDRCNLAIRNNIISVNWDKKDAEYMGMLKIDVLGLSNLSILHYMKELVKQNSNIDIDLNAIDLNDKRILDEFGKGNCIGIFQFGTYGLRRLCRDLKIDSFDLLVDATAIYRPASLRSGMTDKFKVRRFDYKYKYGGKLGDIIDNTFGIIIYQEQVMRIVNEIAGMTFIDADKIRKLLDAENVEGLKKYKYEFIHGCMNNSGISRIDAINIWEMLIKHGGYNFNLSHACGYTILSYINMYFKVYFPAEFFCAVLTYINVNKRQEIIDDAVHSKFCIATPKIGISDSIKWICKDKTIYMPFIEVKGIGEEIGRAHV